MCWALPNMRRHRLPLVAAVEPQSEAFDPLAPLFIINTPQASMLKSERRFVPRIGLAPKDNSTAARIGGEVTIRVQDEAFTKRLVVGATAVLCQIAWSFSEKRVLQRWNSAPATNGVPLTARAEICWGRDCFWDALSPPLAAASANSSIRNRSPCSSRRRSLPPRPLPPCTTTASISVRIALRDALASRVARCCSSSAMAAR